MTSKLLGVFGLMVALALTATTRAHATAPPAENQSLKLLQEFETFVARLVCETELVVKLDGVFQKHDAMLAQGAAGKLPPARFEAEKKAFGNDLAQTWRSEPGRSGVTKRHLLGATAILQSGMRAEAAFAERITNQAAALCPKKAKPHETVKSAVMSLFPLIAGEKPQR